LGETANGSSVKPWLDMAAPINQASGFALALGF
jgi:hypothetical protein